MRLHNSTSRGLRRNRCPTILQAIVLIGTLAAQTSWGQAESVHWEQITPILAATTGENAIGTVVYVVGAFEQRADQPGPQVIFHTASGRFSRLVQTATQETVLYTARSLDPPPDSSTVAPTVPYSDVNIGSNSLSGMVTLSIAALAQSHPVPTHTVLTGTSTPDESIAPVGAVPLKLAAAHTVTIRRILVSDRQMTVETHVGRSASMQIAPVRSVREAFETIIKTSSTP